MSAPSDPVLEDAARLLRGVNRLTRRLRAERRESQLSLSKLSVLGCLLHGGPMAATDLAAAERIQPQSLTRLLADIEKRGLINRARSADDRRRQLIELTPAGLGALRQEMRQRQSWLAGIMEAVLTPAERRQVALAGDILQRLAEAQPAGPSAAPAQDSEAAEVYPTGVAAG